MVKLGLKTTKIQENLAEIVEQPPGWTALPISLRMRRKVIADEAAKRAEDRRQAILDQQEAPMRFRARSKVIFIIFSFSCRSFLDEHMLQSALPQAISVEKRLRKLGKRQETEYRLMEHEAKKERYLDFKRELDGLRGKNKAACPLLRRKHARTVL